MYAALLLVLIIFVCTVLSYSMARLLQLIVKKKIHKKNVIIKGFIKKKKSLKFNETNFIK